MNNATESKETYTIGIPGWKLGENSFGCGINHLDFISKFGNPRILFPHDENVDIDMLYLPGGPDVYPGRYGQRPGFHTTNPDLFRQYFFDNNLKNYVEKGTKIFGICLGMQMLNIHFGGTLTQNMRNHAQSSDRWEAGHCVYTVGDQRKRKFEVNSHHHQAVTAEDLSSEFEAILVADNEDNKDNPIIEGIKHKTLPIIGLQYHPEEWLDDYSITLVKNLLKS